jgi:hypothetical protein
LVAERFAACRIMVAVDLADRDPLGFAMTRLLDGFLYLDTISVAAGQSGRRIGAALLSEAVSHGPAIRAAAITLTTFCEPIWNGPWFRGRGFEPMPSEQIGLGLGAEIKRQAQTLDLLTRETLWLPL